MQRRDSNYCPMNSDPQIYSDTNDHIFFVADTVGVIPYFIGMSGTVSLVIVALANVFMVWRCVQLYRNMDVPSARRVMFSSYIYLPVVLLALLADKL
jgi:protoheme IX farnesyltransferase